MFATGTRPNTFKDGICPACDYFKLFKKVDWEQRREILFDLVDKYKIHQLSMIALLESAEEKIAQDKLYGLETT